ncbi:MAG: hypothetical protein FJW34_21200 [Acidobacteria bacterium]|nr:hypothetical protein [Acidobacteriota bacterium]
MRKVVLSACLAVTAALAQYKLESAGAPPADLTPALREALAKEGSRVVAPEGKPFCEIWLLRKAPSGPETTEQNVSLTTIPHGALVGVIRFPARGADRRGQVVRPGVYTLRYSHYPVDGAHQGVAPQRDFLKIIPAAQDTDLNATPGYDDLVKMSNEASGTSHPAILGVWKREGAGGPPELVQDGEDWILRVMLGDVPVGILVVGIFHG